MEAFDAIPEEYNFALSRGRGNWSAHLTRKSNGHIVATVYGRANAEQALLDVLSAARG